jgi:uncharacterized iron-regulated membrane protein
MRTFKRLVLFIHRWLGFISGLVVFVVSITGAIYCFQDEIQDLLYDYRTVKVGATPMLPPSRLEKVALEHIPKGSISSVLYFGEGRSAQVRLTANSITHSIFINPYTGEYLKDIDLKNTFFNKVKAIHLYCFFPPKTGKWVVSSAVSVFVFLLITGIILWWPKRKSDHKRSFAIKWQGKWRRVNYDLHNVLGFYSFFFSLILALSGLVMSYGWLNKSLYELLNKSKLYPAEISKKKPKLMSDHKKAIGENVLDSTYMAVTRLSPKQQMMIILPGKKESSLTVTAYATALHFGHSDNYTFSKQTGKMLKHLPYDQKSPGLKYRNLNYDVHVGQVAGLTGKILAFFASIISASLPITGLIIYLGKTKKPRRKIVVKE